MGKRHAKRNAKPKVKKPLAIVPLKLPPDHALILAHDPVQGLKVVPVPKAELKKKTWWELVFGE